MPRDSTSVRDASKNRRRARIVAAAHDLLRELGSDGVSVRAIAKRARLSPTTLFNLYGSKGAVLREVYDQDLEKFEQLFSSHPSQDGLESLFYVIKLAGQVFDADPEFYKSILMTQGNDPNGQSLSLLRGSRLPFWERQLRRAEDEDLLDLRSGAPNIALLLSQVMSGANVEWVSGVISIDQWRAEVNFGFAAVLLAFATGSARPRLDEYLQYAHEELLARAAEGPNAPP